jgi:hypothetical protein
LLEIPAPLVEPPLRIFHSDPDIRKAQSRLGDQ